MIEQLAQTVAELPPQLIEATAHPKDDSSAETDPEDGASADDNLLRSALYQKINTTSGATVTAINAFFDSLSVASARGDPGVARAIQRITDHRRQQDNAAAARSARQDSPIADALRRQQRLARLGHLLGGISYLASLPALKAQAEETYGPFQLRSGMVPFHLDLSPACEAVRKFARKQHRQRPKGDYEVGYRKAPVEGRYTTENNPSRQRKPASAWDALDRSLDKPVTVTRANGTQTSSTRRRTSYDGLIRKAIAGDRAARTEVIRRMLDLSARGLMSAPPRAKRAKRRQFSEEDREVVTKAMAVTLHYVSRETIRLLAKNFSADPGIVDHQYDALVARARRAKARQAAQRRAADAGGEGTGGQAAKSASARNSSTRGGSALVPSTRTRTRGVLPAHSQHPTLPRARVPVIKTPTIEAPVRKTPTPSTPGGKRKG